MEGAPKLAFSLHYFVFINFKTLKLSMFKLISDFVSQF